MTLEDELSNAMYGNFLIGTQARLIDLLPTVRRFNIIKAERGREARMEGV